MLQPCVHLNTRKKILRKVVLFLIHMIIMAVIITNHPTRQVGRQQVSHFLLVSQSSSSSDTYFLKEIPAVVYQTKFQPCRLFSIQSPDYLFWLACTLYLFLLQFFILLFGNFFFFKLDSKYKVKIQSKDICFREKIRQL